MYKSDVIAHFGSIPKTAKALQITRAAVWQWKDLIPRGAAYTVQALTNGALMVSPDLYPPKKKPTSPGVNSLTVA